MVMKYICAITTLLPMGRAVGMLMEKLSTTMDEVGLQRFCNVWIIVVSTTIVESMPSNLFMFVVS